MPNSSISAFLDTPVCITCGTHYGPQPAASGRHPAHCPICEDERQYVGWAGQAWTTMRALGERHHLLAAHEGGVDTLVMSPAFAIGQRAFLLPLAPGSQDLVMWECLSLVTPEALAHIASLGQVKAIAISHPHFYAGMAAWSAALGHVPIWLHAEDRAWVQAPCDAVRFWQGERHALSPSLELVHLPGHFAGSTGLWWKDGPRPGGALFPGDAVQVVMDRRFATFMYSYPNAIPLGAAALDRLEARVRPLQFDDVFGYSPGRQIIGGARERVEASFARYRQALQR